MSAPPPQFHDQWPDLLAVARDMLARREAAYPAQIAKGRLTPAEADTRLRIMRAIVRQWEAVLAAAPPPALDASWAEMRAELDDAASRAAARTAHPERSRGADYAACVAALAWHQRPFLPGMRMPHIVFLLNCTLAARRAACPEHSREVEGAA